MDLIDTTVPQWVDTFFGNAPQLQYYEDLFNPKTIKPVITMGMTLVTILAGLENQGQGDNV